MYTVPMEYAHVYSAHEGQEKALDLLDLKFQVVVSCPMWVLGTKRSPAKAVSVLALNLFRPLDCFVKTHMHTLC